MEWIKVEDSLPNIRQECILTNGDYVYYGSLGKDGYFYQIEDFYKMRQENDITHWMPLPKPPNEES